LNKLDSCVVCENEFDQIEGDAISYGWYSFDCVKCGEYIVGDGVQSIFRRDFDELVAEKIFEQFNLFVFNSATHEKLKKSIQYYLQNEKKKHKKIVVIRSFNKNSEEIFKDKDKYKITTLKTIFDLYCKEYI